MSIIESLLTSIPLIYLIISQLSTYNSLADTSEDNLTHLAKYLDPSVSNNKIEQYRQQWMTVSCLIICFSIIALLCVWTSVKG